MRNYMGDGYTVAKNETGRTVYTSACGRFRVRATGAKFGQGAAWCVECEGYRYYALSLKDAQRVIESCTQ
jgi:hypothetical protein